MIILRSIQEERLSAYTTTINTFEIWLGAHLAENPDALVEDTAAFLSRFEIVGLDYESSVEAGRVLARLRRNGKPIDIRDMFVGCISKTNNMSLLTRNVRHYQRIPGLAVMTSKQLAEKLKA